MLEDKLLPFLKHGFFWSEEKGIFPTLDGVWVLVCPVISFGHLVNLVVLYGRCKPYVQGIWVALEVLLPCIQWQMLLPYTVADVIAIFYVVDGLSTVEMICYVIKQDGRCYCHCYVWQMVSHISWLQCVLINVIAMVADGIATQGGYRVSGKCCSNRW